MTTKFDRTSLILLKIQKFLLLNFTCFGNCKISYGIWFTIILFHNVETYCLNIFTMEKPSNLGKQYLKYIPEGIVTFEENVNLIRLLKNI